MSVLIKGMEMPERCAACAFWNGICCAAKSDDGFYGTLVKDTNIKPDWCPLIEIPPHGRLIDADALIEKFSEMENSRMEIPMGIVVIGAINDIKKMPTIIEAEE